MRADAIVAAHSSPETICQTICAPKNTVQTTQAADQEVGNGENEVFGVCGAVCYRCTGRVPTVSPLWATLGDRPGEEQGTAAGGIGDLCCCCCATWRIWASLLSFGRSGRPAGGPNDHRIPDGINEDEPEPLQRRCLLLLPRRPSHGIHMAVSRLALRLSPGCTGTLCISPLASNSAWAFRSPHPTCSFRPSSVHGSIQHRPNNRNVPTGRPSERRLPCPPPS